MDVILFLVVGALVGAGIGIAGLNMVQNAQTNNRKLLAETEIKAIVTKASEEALRISNSAEEKARQLLEEVDTIWLGTDTDSRDDRQ